MLVVSWMSSKLITVSSDDPFEKALQIMKDYRVSHLPVLENGKLAGLVTGSSLNNAVLDGQANGLDLREMGLLKVSDVMSVDPPSVSLCQTVEEAALMMMENGLTGLPVLDDKGEVIAVITASDVMRAMISLSGVSRGGILFALNISDEPGSIQEITDPLRALGGRLASILTSYDRCAEGRRNAFIRVVDLDREKLAGLKDALSNCCEIIYILDSKGEGSEFIKSCMES